MVGQYSSTVSEQFEPLYLLPGECGGKEDVRWMALTDQSGAGLLVTGQPTFHLDALHFTMHDLTIANHVYELHPRPEIYLHLDARHMGVGGDTGWTQNVHPEYLIQPGRYNYSLSLRPITRKVGSDTSFPFNRCGGENRVRPQFPRRNTHDTQHENRRLCGLLAHAGA